MRTPFFFPAMGLSLGVVLARCGWCFSGGLLYAGGPLLLLLLWLSRGRPLFCMFFTAYALLLGMLSYQGSLSRPANAVENYAAAENVNLTGRVVSLPQRRMSGARMRTSFIFAAEKILWLSPEERKTIVVEGRVQVYLYNTGNEIRYGDRLLLHGMLKKMEANPDPDSFDMKKYLEAKDVYSVLRVYGAKPVKLERVPSFSRIRDALIDRLRSETQNRIKRLWKGPALGQFEALILGARQGMAREIYQNFAATGTAHLLSISGLHLALITGGVMTLLAALGWERKEAALAGMLSAAAFAVIGGLSIPLNRSAGMTCAALFAVLYDREKSAFNIFFLTYSVFLFLNPLLLWSISFQLSFLSVLMLIMPEKTWPFRGYATFRQCFAATAGTFPVVLYHFQIFSIVSPAANLISIPLFNAGLASAFAAMALEDLPLAGFIFARLAETFMKSCFSSVAWFAGLPASHVYLPRPPAFLLTAYYGLLGAYCLCRAAGDEKRQSLQRFFGAGVLLTSLLFFVPHPQERFALHLFGGTENLLAHISFQGRNHWIISAGSSHSVPKAVAQKVVPYFRARGIRKAEGLLLDRLGNARSLQAFDEMLRPDFLIHAHPVSSARSLPGAVTRQMRAGDRIAMRNGAVLEMLFVSGFGDICFQIEYEKKRILFIPKGAQELETALKSREPGLEKASLAVIYTGREEAGNLLPQLLRLQPSRVLFLGPPGKEEREALTKAAIPWTGREAGSPLRICENASGELQLKPVSASFSHGKTDAGNP